MEPHPPQKKWEEPEIKDPCAEGMHMGATGKCFDVDAPELTTTHPCPSGQHWDRNRNVCVTEEKCPTGQHWSGYSQVCVPEKKEQ